MTNTTTTLRALALAAAAEHVDATIAYYQGGATNELLSAVSVTRERLQALALCAGREKDLARAAEFCARQSVDFGTMRGGDSDDERMALTRTNLRDGWADAARRIREASEAAPVAAPEPDRCPVCALPLGADSHACPGAPVAASEVAS